MKFKISAEQQAIVNALKTQNVIVDSVAGSGKTTTCIEISKAFYSSSILLLTYNRRLRQETQKRVQNLGLHNIQVHNYHSFVLKYYQYQSYDDIKLKEAMVIRRIQPILAINFNIFILDEAQDMNDLFCQTFLKILMDNQYQQQSFKICVLGDKMQSIYSFNGADSRYITLSDRIFGYLNPFSWERLDLNQSFRLTNQTVEFINKCMLSSDRLFSTKDGPKPIYLICESFTKDRIYEKSNNINSNVIYNKIMYFINSKEYKYEDFFILAPSIKNKMTPVGSLSNLLSTNKVPIFYPNSDEDKIDDDIIKNKIVFSTFHQVKGLERKIVFIFSFDLSYFEFYNKQADNSVCTNELYVAVSRAQKQLVLIHDIQKKHLPFLNTKNIFDQCIIEGDTNIFELKDQEDQDKNAVKKDQIVNVTTLTKHISVDVMEQCLSYLDLHKSQNKEGTIQIQSKSRQEMIAQNGEDINIKETVNEITGTAIPIYFEMQISNSTYVLEITLQIIQGQQLDDSVLQNKIFKDTQDIIKKLDSMKVKMPQVHPQEILYLANLWNSIKANLNFKINQIKDYSWLSELQLQSCYDRFKPQVSNKLEFERELKMFVNVGRTNFHLFGFVDCVDIQNNTVWELKCVDELKGEHFIQLGLYMKIFAVRRTSTFDQIQKLYYELSKIQETPFEPEEELIYKPPNKKEIICTYILEKEKLIQYRFKNKNYFGQIQHFTKKKIREYEEKVQELEKETETVLKEHKFKIFNILTNEIIEIRSDYLRLSKMLDILIQSKYGKPITVEDDTFIQKIYESETYQNTLNKLNKLKYQISEDHEQQNIYENSQQTIKSQQTNYQTDSQVINNSQIQNNCFDRTFDILNTLNSENNSINQINSNLFQNNKSNQKIFKDGQLNVLLEQYLLLSSPQQQLFSSYIQTLNSNSNTNQIKKKNTSQKKNTQQKMKVQQKEYTSQKKCVSLKENTSQKERTEQKRNASQKKNAQQKRNASQQKEYKSQKKNASQKKKAQQKKNNQ